MAMKMEMLLRSNVCLGAGGGGSREGRGKEKTGPGNCLNMELKEKCGT